MTASSYFIHVKLLKTEVVKSLSGKTDCEVGRGRPVPVDGLCLCQPPGGRAG